MRTLKPALASSQTVWLPMNPQPPTTRMCRAELADGIVRPRSSSLNSRDLSVSGVSTSLQSEPDVNPAGLEEPLVL